MMNNRPWVEIAEYVSIAASVVGSVVSVVSGQLIYAVLPLSISLVLNVVNRRRIEQLSRQSSATAIAQKQQLKSAIATMAQEARILVTAVEQLHQQQSNLNQSLSPIQAQLDALTEQFKKRPELEQIKGLTAVITALQHYLDRLPKPDK